MSSPCSGPRSQSAQQGRSGSETKLQTSGDYSAVAKEPLDTLCAFSSRAINDRIILGKKRQQMEKYFTAQQTYTQVIILYLQQLCLL